MTEDEKKVDTGTAQAGSCAGTQPPERAQGANPPTYPRGRDTGKCMAGDTRHSDG